VTHASTKSVLRDHLILRVPFPVGAPLQLSLYTKSGTVLSHDDSAMAEHFTHLHFACHFCLITLLSFFVLSSQLKKPFLLYWAMYHIKYHANALHTIRFSSVSLFYYDLNRTPHHRRLDCPTAVSRHATAKLLASCVPTTSHFNEKLETESETLKFESREVSDRDSSLENYISDNITSIVRENV